MESPGGVTRLHIPTPPPTHTSGRPACVYVSPYRERYASPGQAVLPAPGGAWGHYPTDVARCCLVAFSRTDLCSEAKRKVYSTQLLDHVRHPHCTAGLNQANRSRLVAKPRRPEVSGIRVWLSYPSERLPSSTFSHMGGDERETAGCDVISSPAGPRRHDENDRVSCPSPVHRPHISVKVESILH